MGMIGTKGLYLRSKTWWMAYKLPDGRYIRESAKTANKKAAMDFLAKRRVAIAEGRFLDIKREIEVSFRDFSKLFFERYCKPNKKSWKHGDTYYLKCLNGFFGNKPLSKVTQADIEEYIAIRRATKRQSMPHGEAPRYLMPASVNREISCLKTLFNKAIEWGYLEKSPGVRVKKLKEDNKRTRFLTYEEMEKLLAASSPKFKEALLILLHTGMRRSEFRNLTWSDLDFDSSLIKLTKTKSGKIRYIPMNEAVKQVLLKRRINKESQTWIFAGREDKPWDFRVPFEEARKNAGLSDLRVHDIRHSFASWLCMNGADLMTVKELLGHSSLAMTERYSHLTDYHKAQAVARLEALPINHVTIMSQSGQSTNGEDFEKIVSSLNSSE